MSRPDPAFFQRITKGRKPGRKAIVADPNDNHVLRPVLMRTEDFLHALHHAARQSAYRLDRKM
jgi:hypothetical protein